jgi:hypothetical protein
LASMCKALGWIPSTTKHIQLENQAFHFEGCPCVKAKCLATQYLDFLMSPLKSL